MFLGIEIGGTKLQIGVGDGAAAELLDLVRADINPEDGAAGILEQIRQLGGRLLEKHAVRRIGIGFGGPIDAGQGRIIKSHQIRGWDNFHMAEWCRSAFDLPVVLGNDCDVATLAEVHFGAGQGRQVVFYVTVGTGVGGGLAVDGKLLGQGRPAASEIGHLRPGLHAVDNTETVESLASGWGIAAAAQARLTGQVSHSITAFQDGDTTPDAVVLKQRLASVRDAEQEYVADLLNRCDGSPEQLTARMVAQAADDGNLIAQSVVTHACEVLGWAIAQTITLLAPEVVIVGGGVSLMGESLFFAPLRQAVTRYVFGPLADSYALVPAALGERVVVQGAVYIAAHGT